MPLKLVTSRNAKTKNLYIRGKYLGIAVDKSCGTNKRSVAQAILKRIEKEIELGDYQKPVGPAAPTFLSAAIAYLEAGRRKRYVAKLIKHFGETSLDQIDQTAIDAAAIALHPNASGATRNAAVYTPVSAILRHAGIDLKLRRPKGAKGRIVSDWLSPARNGSASSYCPRWGKYGKCGPSPLKTAGFIGFPCDLPALPQGPAAPFLRGVVPCDLMGQPS